LPRECVPPGRRPDEILPGVVDADPGTFPQPHLFRFQFLDARRSEAAAGWRCTSPNARSTAASQVHRNRLQDVDIKTGFGDICGRVVTLPASRPGEVARVTDVGFALLRSSQPGWRPVPQQAAGPTGDRPRTLPRDGIGRAAVLTPPLRGRQAFGGRVGRRNRQDRLRRGRRFVRPTRRSTSRLTALSTPSIELSTPPSRAGGGWGCGFRVVAGGVTTTAARSRPQCPQNSTRREAASADVMGVRTRRPTALARRCRVLVSKPPVRAAADSDGRPSLGSGMRLLRGNGKHLTRVHRSPQKPGNSQDGGSSASDGCRRTQSIRLRWDLCAL
jgi:hypothetical protein